MASSSKYRGGDDGTPLNVLADSHRRHALDILCDADVPMALADLAHAIALRESGESDGETEWERIKRIYIALYHNHLPRLDERELVEFDSDCKMVTVADSSMSGRGKMGLKRNDSNR